MEQPVNKALKDLLNKTLLDLEETLQSDVLTYYGSIMAEFNLQMQQNSD